VLAALAADLLALVHLAFILFVALGVLLVLRWPALVFAHLPAVVWGIFIELHGGVLCPLTPLEQTLRRTAGKSGYDGGFIDHYIMPLIYPPGLTRGMQIGLGLGVLAVNLIGYGVLVARRRRVRRSAGAGP
jgi:hypothetical protein